MPANIKRQRTRFWNENPHCCYCGCMTILPEDLPVEYGYATGQLKSPPDNMATIEHIYSRLNPKRGVKTGARALACYKCNAEKSVIDENELPLEFRKKLYKMKTYRERKRAIVHYHEERKALKAGLSALKK